VHIVGIGDPPILITNDWKLQRTTGNFTDVVDPSSVRFDCICRETDQLDPALCEFVLLRSERSELGGANWSVVLRMRIEDSPVVPNPFVEIQDTDRRLSPEIGRSGTETKAMSLGVTM
jgi:hypothetical protein